MRNVEIIVNGRVQGVGFRYHTREMAEEFNIKGFVQNRSDGSVYIHASGTINEVEQFVDWCRKGPRFAFVESVTILELPEQQFDNFTVR